MITKLPLPAELLDLMLPAVCVVDVDGHLLFVNASFKRMFGYAPDEVLGRQIFDLIHPDDRAETLRQAEQVTAGELQLHFRNRYIHKDGHTVDIQWSARWAPEHGVRIGVAHEVTELRRAERELEHRASHDPLTGLPNRHRLERELQRAIAHANNTGDGLALLYLDLDGFKGANDRGGHETGDRVLREVARRLLKGLRQNDLVARVGGDEFVALLPGCANLKRALIVADGLRAKLSPPYMLPDGLFRLDASIGIACFPENGDDAEALLAHADRAMYAAKRRRYKMNDAG
jgi:diguanylate cyclase (GGDEF)-like protein/PAS domain S-box-containing protein